MQNEKVLAFYLPQFYEVEENNIWWGNGFTEWTNIKKAKALFKGHQQPVVPYKNNYYCLMDKHIVEWQTRLAKEYGIYGFAYYHYWYEGKKLLEKPAENLLYWQDINQDFCFFWANHTWYRSVGDKKTILIKQSYGDKRDWIHHYEYLRPFFLDGRYIKVDNKPFLGIYMPKDIPDIDDMIKLWDNMAKADGFDGIYVVESINNLKDCGAHYKKASKYTSACMLRQPNIAKESYAHSFIHLHERIKNKMIRILQISPKEPRKCHYDQICAYERKLTKTYKDPAIFYSIATGWDNTSRHGTRGEVFIGQSPKEYERTLRYICGSARKNGHKFVFINAWNEWAEGMYLEPDEINQYAYLTATRKAIK